MTGVVQSGVVTPNHLAAWTTDGIIQDAGVTFLNTYGQFVSSLIGINFNAANTDNPININIPAGYTRYRIDRILIAGATATLVAATVGVFTAQSAAGTAVVTGGSAVTVSAALADTVNNMQSLAINNQNTMALSDATLYFRVQTPQGSAATANISVFYEPLP